jgi:hypothetical protein
MRVVATTACRRAHRYARRPAQSRGACRGVGWSLRAAAIDLPPGAVGCRLDTPGTSRHDSCALAHVIGHESQDMKAEVLVEFSGRAGCRRWRHLPRTGVWRADWLMANGRAGWNSSQWTAASPSVPTVAPPIAAHEEPGPIDRLDRPESAVWGRNGVESPAAEDRAVLNTSVD